MGPLYHGTSEESRYSPSIVLVSVEGKKLAWFSIQVHLAALLRDGYNNNSLYGIFPLSANRVVGLVYKYVNL